MRISMLMWPPDIWLMMPACRRRLEQRDDAADDVMRNTVLRESPLELLGSPLQAGSVPLPDGEELQALALPSRFLHLPAAVSSLLVQLFNTDIVHREGCIRLRVLLLELVNIGLRLCEGRNLRINLPIAVRAFSA